MLGFFRKYQRFFFIIVTAVVVVTFSFFGVNSGPGGSMVNPRDNVYFHTDSGRAVTRGEVEDMVLFLSTDALDSQNSERLWGYNFLNDGVIRKEFLETGFAELLFAEYREALGKGIQERARREKHFRAYKHPQAAFVNAELAWNYFAPQVKIELERLRQASDPISDEAFAARVQLFLAEKRFPAMALRQALLVQQEQYDWLPADPQLRQADLSLFNYHSISDWFGQDFTHLIAQFIINSAEKAEALGYQVSKEEVKADLLRNSEISFRDRARHPQMRLSHSGENYAEQLRLMQMGDSQVIPLWRQVMLFRRLFHDVGNATLVDPLVYKKFNEYAKEGVNTFVYELPPALRLRRFTDLQRFETYVKAVGSDVDGLDLPKSFRPVEQVAKANPELVQQRYLVEVAEVDKATLQTRVTVRDTWDWQVQDAGWDLLKQEFRELGIRPANTEEERFALLQELDGNTRLRVDSFTRQQIVEENADWLEEAMEQATMTQQTLHLRMRGGHLAVKGINDRPALASALDKAELDDELLDMYSQDQRHYYRIKVIDRSDKPEILTFAEASHSGILDEMIDRELESHYQKIREGNPILYRGEDGEWRALGEVKREVARDYFQKSVTAINEDYHSWRRVQPATASETDKTQFSTEEDRAASRRLISWMRSIHQQRMDDPQFEESLIAGGIETVEEGKLAPAPKLEDQWKLLKREHPVYRHGEEILDVTEALTLGEGDWSVLHTSPSGNIYFFNVGQPIAQELSVVQQMDEGRELLSKEARLSLFGHLLAELKEDGEMTLDYLQRRVEAVEDEG